MIISLWLILYGILLSYFTGVIFHALLCRIYPEAGTFLFHRSLYPVLGLVFISFITGVYHLFFPVDWLPHLFFLSMIIGSGKQLKEAIALPNRGKLVFVAAAIFCAALAITGRPGTGDIADYHLQGIKWAEFYANIPGLGNFNRPLANNNWWFNVQAFLGFINPLKSSVYPGNAIYFVSVLCWFVFSPVQHNGQRWFRAMIVVFIILSLKAAFIGAVTPDIIVTFTLFILADIYLKYALDKQKAPSVLLLMVILIAWILTVKATAISFGMLALPLVYEMWQRRNTGFILKLLGAVLLIMAPWIYGNVLVSGYLLYPFHQIDLFNPDWKIPASVLQWETFSIKNWGKVWGQDVYVTAAMSPAQWIPLWFSQLDIMNKMLVAGFVAGTPVVWFLSYKKVELRWLVLFVFCGFALFFMNGPHPRFLFGYMVLTLAMLLQGILDEKVFVIQHKVYLFFMLAIGGLLLLKEIREDKFALVNPLPYPGTKALTPLQMGSFYYFETHQSGQCWDNWPCTYYKVDSVVMRTNDVKDGFKIKH